MKLPQSCRRVRFAQALALPFALLWLSGCGTDAATSSARAEPVLPALRLVLADHIGASTLDEQIRSGQQLVRERADVQRLERLATLFISKARAVGDPGYYRLAECCADAMPAADGGYLAAQLVRGHVRHALHDFGAAEQIARELVAQRGLFLDHGLLGDVLLDLGRFDEARDVYQQMLQLKPCLQSYARGAQVRWLMGDLDGSRELLDLAARSGSQRAPESLAWVLTRRAALELQADDAQAAAQFAARALEQVPGYPAALLWAGRAALAAGDAATAVQSLEAAVAKSPLPEYLWACTEALRSAGRVDDAVALERQLDRTGEREDPRTFALWLASFGREPARALQIVEAELLQRQDCYTLHALALARLRVGDATGALAAMRQALAIGVVDARLSVHTALIADAAGDRELAREHTAIAGSRLAALLPSERRTLSDLAQRL